MKLTEVNKGYTKAASSYDGILRFWFGSSLRVERHRRKAIGSMGLNEGDTVLDIGCGTGINFPILQKEIGEGGSIIGFDYTDAMLAEARRCVEKNGWKNVTLQKGDAVHINRSVKKVDAVISTYCFSLLYDAELAFKNAVKTLKRGGRITILDITTVRHKHILGRVLFKVYSWIVLRYGIASENDLAHGFNNKKKQWQHIAERTLADVTKKEFLLGIGVVYSGVKK